MKKETSVALMMGIAHGMIYKDKYDMTMSDLSSIKDKVRYASGKRTKKQKRKKRR